MANGILVLDFGTSSVRAILYDADSGKQLKSCSNRYRHEYINPVIMELDPEMVWRKSEQAVEAVMMSLEPDIRILSLAFSFFGDNVMAVDGNGNPLTNLILTSDGRGSYEANYINENLGARQVELTGEPCRFSCPSAKILWMKNNAPDIFRGAAGFWNIQQFILSRLGFANRTDYTMASRMVLFDNRKWQWAEDILDVIGIARRQLGAVTDTGAVIGTADHYGKTGLPASIPVVLGGHDVALGVLGVGIYKENQNVLANITGTYEHMAFLSRDKDGLASYGKMGAGVYSYCGPIPGMTLHVVLGEGIGLKIDNFLYEAYGNISQTSFENLWKHIDFGLLNRGRFSEKDHQEEIFQEYKYRRFAELITALTDIADLAQTVCRSINPQINRIRVGGGFAKADKWMQFRANRFKIPIERIFYENASALGAAVLAASAIDYYAGLQEASEALVHISKVFYPDETL